MQKLKMYCEKCNKRACSILDLNCDKCGKRLCRECGISLKCYKCRILVCECYKTECQYDCDGTCEQWCFKHKCMNSLSCDLNDEESFELANHLDDDEYIIHTIYDKYSYYPYTYKYDNIDNVVRAGKLTKEIAQYIVGQLNMGIVSGSNEDRHIDADQTLYWFIDSIKFYKTLDEAKKIGDILKNIGTNHFWYA